MKIGIIAASGKLGNILLSKLNNNPNYQTTAIVRDSKKILSGNNILEKDIFALNSKDIEKFDYVICAYGPPQENPDELVEVTKHIIKVFSNQNPKLIICGGVGPLYLDPKKTIRVCNSEEVPENFKNLAKAEARAFDLIKNEKTFSWLYFAPPFELSLDYQVNNKYVASSDTLRLSDKKTSILSYHDFSDAILDSLSADYKLNNQLVSISEQ